MNERTFLDAIVPEPTQVLGRRLLPFSLGHLVLLKYLEVSFVTGERTTMDDVTAAAWICSNTFEDGLASLSNPHGDQLMADWCAQLMMPTWLHRLGLRKPKPIDWPEKEQLLSEHINDALKVPTFIETQQGEGIAVPSWQVIRVVLMRDLGLSETEVMNRSYRLSVADYLTLKATDGRITLVDDDAIAEAQRFAAEFDKEFREKHRN